ncbi:MAG: glucosamine--fructose-6-phosphate aminotransferase (isomerizing) [Puniceicoccaceae bacterium 5H]|nr:MAG: glucosamine--fructose-6-phosphate aminotransferase (isomerizing) [Puniceicoccaceae bacterium 5H]
MCGIVGYVGDDAAPKILVEGLNRLAYRGYDSAGHALMNGSGIKIFKDVGSPEHIGQVVMKEKVMANSGISHTRWATHGGVTPSNSHPHLSNCGRIALVHNGVIENFVTLRNRLQQTGVTFHSETDTEVLCNLIASYYEDFRSEGHEDAFLHSVFAALREVKGSYGIAVMCGDQPGRIITARLGSSLVLGIGNGENMVASDAAAFCGRTNNIVYLDDGQVACLTGKDFEIFNLDNERVAAEICEVQSEHQEYERGDFPHFMLKEIFEQPEALRNSMRGRFSSDNSTTKFGGLNLEAKDLRRINRILFMGCGTAWHACLLAKYIIEKLARIPVDVEYASELRYRNAPIPDNTLVFVISQSGETADTLEALREMKRKGFETLAITNVVGSTIAHEAGGGIYQHVGPEIGVASTKAFSSQVLLTTMVGVFLGRLRDLSMSEGMRLVKGMQELPDKIVQVLQKASELEALAKKYAEYNDFLFLGRQMMFPLALEGALKLKEISYIHAEGYPAAEMKHGPLALVSPTCPSLFIAPEDEMIDKVASNIQEVKARGGPVIVITTEGSPLCDQEGIDVIAIPQTCESLMPILASIPLQLFSYYAAVARGCNVDRPRNLAKSVTVE